MEQGGCTLILGLNDKLSAPLEAQMMKMQSNGVDIKISVV
jgi:hypothetical protein